MASDISVCFDINSAGFLAGLANQKAIYWDFSGAKLHPLYKIINNKKLIFKSSEEIEKNLKLFEKGNNDIGCHKNWINIIDPFRDGKGPERAGFLFEKFINEIINGNSKDKALRNAVNKYSKIWGDDKVSHLSYIKENLAYNLWKDTRINVQNNLKDKFNKG